MWHLPSQHMNVYPHTQERFTICISYPPWPIFLTHMYLDEGFPETLHPSLHPNSWLETALSVLSHVFLLYMFAHSIGTLYIVLHSNSDESLKLSNKSICFTQHNCYLKPCLVQSVSCHGLKRTKIWNMHWSSTVQWDLFIYFCLSLYHGPACVKKQNQYSQLCCILGSGAIKTTEANTPIKHTKRNQ